jgi:hypothetical protein
LWYRNLGGFFPPKKKGKNSRIRNIQFLKSKIFLFFSQEHDKSCWFFSEQFSFPLKFNNKIYALFNSKFVFFSRGKVWKKHVSHIREGLEYMHFHDLRPVSETIRINLNWRIDIMPHYANQISLPLIVQGLKHSKIGSSSMYLLA